MLRLGRLRRRHLGSEADRTTFRTLHTASLASHPLRDGLTTASAQRAVRHLHTLLGVNAVALTDAAGLLAWEGAGAHHGDDCARFAEAVEKPDVVVLSGADVACGRPGCELRRGIVAPLIVEDRLVGTLQVFGPSADAALVRATEEVAEFVTSQLELAELSHSRTRLAEAEVRLLRAQISPHFIYNSLSAIAAFVRTDPDRARDLLLEFADFTRYSFRRHGDFTTLEEELRAIERYLLLERARFGDRLTVTLRIAPEVLGVSLPFLCLQPLVENAVQHGLADGGGGQVTIIARDLDRECLITVEDDGAGEDPERVRRALAGDDPGLESVGLGNVDERLRTSFGDDYGLVVETAPGAGTKVIVRVPKYAPGVHP